MAKFLVVDPDWDPPSDYDAAEMTKIQVAEKIQKRGWFVLEADSVLDVPDLFLKVYKTRFGSGSVFQSIGASQWFDVYDEHDECVDSLSFHVVTYGCGFA